MPFSSWRGIVGMINPTMRPGVRRSFGCHDKAFIGEGFDLSPIDGVEVTKLLARSAATPKKVIDRYNALVTARRK